MTKDVPNNPDTFLADEESTSEQFKSRLAQELEANSTKSFGADEEQMSLLVWEETLRHEPSLSSLEQNQVNGEGSQVAMPTKKI